MRGEADRINTLVFDGRWGQACTFALLINRTRHTRLSALYSVTIRLLLAEKCKSACLSPKFEVTLL